MKNNMKYSLIEANKFGSGYNLIWTVDLRLISSKGSYDFNGGGKTLTEAQSDACKQICEELKILDNIPRNYIGELNNFCHRNGIVDLKHNSTIAGNNTWDAKTTLTFNNVEYVGIGNAKKTHDAKNMAAQQILEQISKIRPQRNFSIREECSSGPKLSILSASKLSIPGPKLSILEPEKPFSGPKLSVLETEKPFSGPKIPIPSNNQNFVTSFNNKKENCPCHQSVKTDVILYFDGDNVPNEACKHFNYKAYIFVGKLTAFPPVKFENNLCSNSTVIRCNWHSSDAVDVLIAMQIAQNAILFPNVKSIIISGDKIFQSVANASLQLTRSFEIIWDKKLPENYINES